MKINSRLIGVGIITISLGLFVGCTEDLYEDDDYDDSGSSLTTSTSSSSSPSSTTSSGSSQCDANTDTYTPFNDPQYDTHCQLARTYQCAGNEEAKKSSCDTLDAFLQNTGGTSSDIAKCLACN